ncbi:MAG: DUF2127 domain-containing protein [Verrucomicrobiota bacterium]
MSDPESRVAPWEDIVLRVIAIWKLFHAAFFTAVGFGLLKLRHHNVVDFLNSHLIIPYHLNPEKPFVDWMLAEAAKVSPHTLFLLGWAAFLYAALFAAEGVGLYLRKRWAEWLVVVVTGSLLPLEIYELVIKIALWKAVAVIGNLLIVGYLIHRVTLEDRVQARLERENRKRGDGPGTAAPGAGVAAPGADAARTGHAAGSNGDPLESSRRVATKVR